MQFLSCEDNNLSSLDVSNGIKLFEISCESNNLTSLDISSNTELAMFNCDSNPGENGIFRVTAPWIDKGAIPQYFATGSWQYDGRTVTIEYVRSGVNGVGQNIYCLAPFFRSFRAKSCSRSRMCRSFQTGISLSVGIFLRTDFSGNTPKTKNHSFEWLNFA